jgi:hypothetical protein
MEQMKKYCNQQNVKYNFNKTKVMVFKKKKKGAGEETERQRMLVHVLSKTSGSTRIYLFRGKARKFRRVEETKRKYKSKVHL